MFENTQRIRGVLGAAAGSTLCAGLAVVAGIIPQSGDTTTSIQAAALVPIEAVVPTVTDPAPTTVIEEEAAPEEAPVTTEPPTTVPEVTITAPPVTAAPAPPPPEDAAVEAPPAEAPPAPEAPASGAVPRRVPSGDEVSQALEGLKPFIQSPFSPGAAQVAEAGEKVCTAFDEGRSMDEVKAEGLALVKKVPFTTVKEGAADYVVRTAVTLYCPGHASKLA